MTKAAKIALIVAGVTALIMIVLIGSAVYWWSTKGQQFLEEGRKAAVAGKKFGKSTDEKGCLGRTLKRLDACTDLPCEINKSVFLANCLYEAEKTPGFCKGVPPMSEITESVKWRAAACGKLGRKDQRCQRIHSVVQKYCTKGTKK